METPANCTLWKFHKYCFYVVKNCHGDAWSFSLILVSFFYVPLAERLVIVWAAGFHQTPLGCVAPIDEASQQPGWPQEPDLFTIRRRCPTSRNSPLSPPKHVTRTLPVVACPPPASTHPSIQRPLPPPSFHPAGFLPAAGSPRIV